MRNNQPTIAFSIDMCDAVDDLEYFVYTQAYGLEMTIDEEWAVNTIIMCPPHLISLMTQKADVASMGVIPGANCTLEDGNYTQIVKDGGKWVLARRIDNISKILDADLGIILYIAEPSELDKDTLNDDRLNATNFIVAFQISSVSTLEIASSAIKSIRDCLAGSKTANCQILISGLFDHENLIEYARLCDVAGLLLLNTSYEAVIELLRQVAV